MCDWIEISTGNLSTDAQLLYTTDKSFVGSLRLTAHCETMALKLRQITKLPQYTRKNVKPFCVIHLGCNDLKPVGPV